jgi:septum site-determining protein MinC
MTENVSIKGTSEGLVIRLGSGPLDQVLTEMATLLTTKASFFLGGRVALHVGDRPLSVEKLTAIGSMLQELGVTLWAVEGEHPTTHAAAEQLGLETADPTGTARLRVADEPRWEQLSGVIMRQTLRSGQAINHAGHVALIGDVNPGAEIVAGGNIIVWGALRGTAHAGAMGDENAVICALELTPRQIRIGSLIARSPERGRPPRMPEMASVQDDRIVVESWKRMGRSFELGKLRLELGD